MGPTTTLRLTSLMALIATATAAFALGPKQSAVRVDSSGNRARTFGAVLRQAQGGSSAAVSDWAPGRPAGVLCPLPPANCQPRDIQEARTSNRVNFVVADDFLPATGDPVSSVCWRGAYFDFETRLDCGEDVLTDRFEIRYFEDDGGVPDPDGIIAHFRQEQPGTSLEITGPNLTGDRIAQSADEYEFFATHADVPLTAGQCYWIEISNEVSMTDPNSDCRWVWETALPGNQWSLQDFFDGDTGQLDGYDTSDVLGVDFRYCLDIRLDDPGPCVPLPPENDDCSDAEAITGNGTFSFDNTAARTDGEAHAACLADEEDQIEADLWYCWTAPCTDTAVVSTCQLTGLDTRIAVYDGCEPCPPTDQDLLACNDDRCGEPGVPFQSLVTFNAVAGSRYRIRIGVFPGKRRGVGSFTVGCGACGGAGCGGAVGSCCDTAGTGSAGCDDETCCNIVCMCDPKCCNTEWDQLCATTGYDVTSPGCGAELLCADRCSACGTSEVDCCVGGSTGDEVPGCSDPVCCEAVCAVDDFCCDVRWDQSCANFGTNNNGHGAQVLCPELCGTSCPEGPVEWLDPPDGVVDARQPFSPADAGRPVGIETITVRAPLGADRVECWGLCEREGAQSPNHVADVEDNPDGTLTIRLARPITPGVVTTLTYRGTRATASFAFHPGNPNGDVQANRLDFTALLDTLTGAGALPWGVYSADADRSGALGPADLLRVIDLLAGSDPFTNAWNDSCRPSAEGVCP